MGATSIQWTDAVWNPVRGCSRISPGCEHCYAETMAARFSGPGQWAHGIALRSPARWTRKVALVPEMLEAPLHWKKPRRIFVNSMSDLFHADLMPTEIGRVFEVMERCPQHTFQILTKRADVMRNFMQIEYATEPPPANVWLGVSVEDRQRADERIQHLLRTPAAVRFLSCEPLLEPVDLRPSLRVREARHTDVPSRDFGLPVRDIPVAREAPAISWVIVGGESGAGARPMDLAWARSIVEQCKAAGVACFVKQLGKSPETYIGVDEEGTAFYSRYQLKPDRAHGGNPAEWPADLRVREFPKEPRHG